MTVAIDTSIIKAYEGKTSGRIKDGNTGITPIATPRGWFAPVRVLCRELNAIMLTVTRKTADIPTANVRTVILAKRETLVPRYNPIAVFRITAKVKIEAANTKEDCT